VVNNLIANIFNTPWPEDKVERRKKVNAVVNRTWGIADILAHTVHDDLEDVPANVCYSIAVAGWAPNTLIAPGVYNAVLKAFDMALALAIEFPEAAQQILESRRVDPHVCDVVTEIGMAVGAKYTEEKAKQ
jgi:hypothetical protein